MTFRGEGRSPWTNSFGIAVLLTSVDGAGDASALGSPGLAASGAGRVSQTATSAAITVSAMAAVAAWPRRDSQPWATAARRARGARTRSRQVG